MRCRNGGQYARIAAVLIALVPCVRPLIAQGNAQCNSYGSGLFGSTEAKNTCNAAVDGAYVFAPVAGILISGGNPFLGATGGLGGFPHLGVTLRANATNLVIPDFNYNGEGTTVGSKQKLFAPAPLVEAALGLFRGVRGGSLAIDVLGSAQLLPTTLIKDVHVDVNARRIGSIALGLGIGGRLTLLGDRGGLPAVTVSVMHRSLPQVGVGNIVGGDRYEYASNLAANLYRVDVGKRFGPLDLGAGAGWTEYRADPQISFINPVTGNREPTISLHVTDSRTVGFVDGGLALGTIYLIGEAGLQAGKDLGLATTFSGNDPGTKRFFGSIGLRFGF